ncbi:LADA_0F01134g1_1 [Lachancea dasiensis]|uniref:LADA_0F01134g1_1 n=1 Tax=Lachancea dasiensis TaxID=1072105 RepID=A0A1G4JI26_9SACH|nr:LADA_0F01134g1_1 [Lachancea dasiensis]
MSSALSYPSTPGRHLVDDHRYQSQWCDYRLTIQSTPKTQVIAAVLDSPHLKTATEAEDMLRPHFRRHELSSIQDSRIKPFKGVASKVDRVTDTVCVAVSGIETPSDDASLSDDLGLSNDTNCPAQSSPIEDVSISSGESKETLLSTGLTYSVSFENKALHEEPASDPPSNRSGLLLSYSKANGERQRQLRCCKPELSCRSRIKLEGVKPILKRPSHTKSLNYVVTASNGSLAYATVFATEMNASNANIPLPANRLERVTIPLHARAKDQLQLSRRQNSCLDESDPGSPRGGQDAAIIRAYEYEYRASHTCLGLEKAKKLRWDKDV